MRFTSRPLPTIYLLLTLATCTWLPATPIAAQESAPVSVQRPASLEQPVTMLPQAHAHNDYLHEQPLLDALTQGFGSVEADIFLVDGELQVAHTRSELAPERTLRALYLEPLKRRITEHQGSVYGDGKPFTLLIDIKTDAEATYRALNDLLAQYSQILTHSNNEVEQAGAVTAIVSGNRPIELIRHTSPRYASIDGRLSDLDGELPPSLMPLISDNWSSHFSWRGVGQLPPAEQQKLQDIVARTHAQHRRLRFWATPDSPAMWSVLHDAGVDLINTDDLAGLSEFLRGKK